MQKLFKKCIILEAECINEVCLLILFYTTKKKIKYKKNRKILYPRIFVHNV